MSEAIAITGLGMTTCLGPDTKTTWEGIRQVRSGIVALENWPEDQATRIGGPLMQDPEKILPGPVARRLDRFSASALVAFKEAWAQSGIDTVEPERTGVVVATGLGGLGTILANYDIMKERGADRLGPLGVPMLMPNAAAATIGLELGARAGVRTPISACASGAEALIMAADLIRQGDADVVVAGGSEAVLMPLAVGMFSAMRATSRRNLDPQGASRPYDVERDGFVMSEGAGILIFEKAEHALARGASILGWYLGGAVTSDGHHIAQPHPEGLGAGAAMRKALQDAGLDAKDICHVNAHATSTPQGDVAEAKAIRAVLGGQADQAKVTATKSMTGHLLGAAGAVEAAFTVLALRDRHSPTIKNLEEADPLVELNLTKEGEGELPAGQIQAISNAFGFGGHNVCVVFASA